MSDRDLDPRNLGLIAVAKDSPIQGNRAWADIDQEGVFRFLDLPPGEYDLLLIKQPGKGRLSGLVDRRVCEWIPWI